MRDPAAIITDRALEMEAQERIARVRTRMRTFHNASEGWHFVGETGEPPFTGGWVNSADDRRQLCFRRNANAVEISGFVSQSPPSPPNSKVFVLPSDFAPSTPSGSDALVYAGMAWSGPPVGVPPWVVGVISIRGDGEVHYFDVTTGEGTPGSGGSPERQVMFNVVYPLDTPTGPSA